VEICNYQSNGRTKGKNKEKVVLQSNDVSLIAFIREALQEKILKVL